LESQDVIVYSLIYSYFLLMSEVHSKYIFQKQPNIGAVLEATV